MLNRNLERCKTKRDLYSLNMRKKKLNGIMNNNIEKKRSKLCYNKFKRMLDKFKNCKEKMKD